MEPIELQTYFRTDEAPAHVSRHGGAVKHFVTPVFLWKKGVLPGPKDLPCIIKLWLPPGEPLVYPEKPSGSWNNDKLRARKVYVLAIEDPDYPGYVMERTTAYSPVRYAGYPVGSWVRAKQFSDDTSTVDAPGIHCFARRIRAVHWKKGRSST